MNFYDIFSIVASIILAAIFLYLLYRLNKLLDTPKEWL